MAEQGAGLMFFSSLNPHLVFQDCLFQLGATSARLWLHCLCHQCFHRQKWRRGRKWSWDHVKWSLQEKATETTSIPVSCLWLFSCLWVTGWLLRIAGTRLTSLLFTVKMRQLWKKLEVCFFILLPYVPPLCSDFGLPMRWQLIWYFVIAQLCIARKKHWWEVASVGDISNNLKRNKTLRSLKGFLDHWLSF